MGCFGGGGFLAGLGVLRDPEGCLLVAGAAGAALRLPGPSERAAAHDFFSNISRGGFKVFNSFSRERLRLRAPKSYPRPLAKHSGRWGQ